ncbi:MAG: hypothetical protein WBA76_21895 [Phormidesmis sp.]
MAYDSKTYGQSPFGSPLRSDDANADEASKSGSIAKPAKPTETKPVETKPIEKLSQKTEPPAAEGLDQAAKADPKAIASNRKTAKSAADTSRLVSPFSKSGSLKPNSPSATDSSSAAAQTRKSRSSRSTAKAANRKSTKSKAAKTTQAETDDAETAIAQRFFEEDRSAYLSLLYKTIISGLVWAVLRLAWTVLQLSNSGLSKEAIALIKIAIHPAVIATVALACAVALTFWTRHLLKDLAAHTQQLHIDAEAPAGNSFRPTLEIIGDSLAYNPKLRKNIALLFDAASILICSLASYLIAFVLFPISL